MIDTLEQWVQTTYPNDPQTHRVITAFVYLSHAFITPGLSLTKENIPQVREQVMRVLDALHVLEASFNDRTE